MDTNNKKQSPCQEVRFEAELELEGEAASLHCRDNSNR